MGSVRTVGWMLLLCGLTACGGGLGPDLDIPEIEIPDVPAAPQLREKPTVAVADNGKATCVWVGDGQVHAERFIPGYGWTDAYRIDWDDAPADDPQVSMDPEGDAIVVWTQDGEVMAACFEVGQGWQQPVIVSAPGGPPANGPQVGTDDEGMSIIVWEEDGNVVSRGFDPMDGWLAPLPVAVPPSPAAEVDVAVSPDGDAVAVWTHASGDVAASAFDAGTGTWSAPMPLGAGSSPSVAAAEGDQAVVVFVDGDDVETVAMDPVDGWLAPERVPLPSTHVDEPARTPEVAIAPTGDAIVVMEVDGDVLASHRPAGTGFGEAQSVLPAAAPTARPQVAMDDAGNGIVVTEDDRGRVQRSVWRETHGRWTPPVEEAQGVEPVIDANGSGEAVSVFIVDERRGVGAMRVQLDQVPMPEPPASGE